MGFFKVFRSEPVNPEIERLQKLAKATPDYPGPHIDLAKGYFDCLQASGEWNKDLIKKGFDSFHNAIELASKISPSETHIALLALMESALNLNARYYALFQEDQNLQRLEHCIWNTEHALDQVKSDPDMVGDLRSRLSWMWSYFGANKLLGIKSAPDLKELLRQIDECIAKAESYAVATPETIEFQISMAEELLDLGEELAKETDGFELYGEPDVLFQILNKKHRPMQDDKREEAAWRSAVMLEYGLKWLAKFPDRDEYEIRFEVSQEILKMLFVRYFFLHAAHARLEDGITILEHGIKTCPNGEYLHYYLGVCYCVKGDQMRHNYSKTAEWLPDTMAIVGGSLTETRAKDVYKKAALHFDRAHELDPENYPRADEVIDHEFL